MSKKTLGRRKFSFLVDGWQAIDVFEQWVDNLPGASEGRQAMVNAASGFDRSFWRTRPDLGYAPANPRLQIGDAGLVREVRFHIRPGTFPELAEVLQELAALYERHSIARRRIVWVQVAGADGPAVSTFHFARDAADRAEQAELEQETMGDELVDLRRRLSSFAAARVFVDWTVRPDLAYQTTN